MGASITLLGRFAVSVAGHEVPAEEWTRRRSAAMVKLLALAPNHRMHREQVVEALWPDVPLHEAAPRLHKAAHYARRALGGGDALVLRGELVQLLPDDGVRVDALEFLHQGRTAVASRDTAAAEAALRLHTGPLLPDDPYEPWAEQVRDDVAVLHRDLLRCAGRWSELLVQDDTDEQAHLALAHRLAACGDVHGALRQLERLDRALRTQLGTSPGAEAVRLREHLLTMTPSPRRVVPGGERRLVGRRPAGDALRAALATAGAGNGTTLLVSGPAGIGKSAVLDLAARRATEAGWRVGRGTASAVEGGWPYACVLEALSDLCRRDPGLLDGLAAGLRSEIDRALSGRTGAWTGESSHQCLFVATAELLRLAAGDVGVMLVVDDVHEADQASLRLLHYLARCAVDLHAVLVLARRSGAGGGSGTRGGSGDEGADVDVDAMAASLLGRGMGSRLELPPLDRAATHRLLQGVGPDLDRATSDRIWLVSGGVPFTALELARQLAAGETLDTRVSTVLPDAALATVRRLALLGAEFDTDDVTACAGTSSEDAFSHLDTAVTEGVVEPTGSGYRFRHGLVREAVLDGVAPHERRRLSREVAVALQGMDAAPARVAHHLLAAGDPGGAVPHVRAAVETWAALGAYQDALAMVDAVLDHAHGEDLARLLARRGDLLTALGDQRAVAAYSRALPLTRGTDHRLVRARLARACCFVGDFETAAAALEGLETVGDAADGPVLLARGNLAYFTGDVDTAWEVASRARRILLTADDPWHYVDLVALQGMIAHNRGEWFERLRLELRRTRDDADLATALFDAHLCVAEYLLYGPVPYAEVLELGGALRDRARSSGALRGVAFATALLGEAALLMGDLARAERELVEAVDLHRDVTAPAGEAHSLQRLAELRLLQGRPEEARRLLQRALPLARWSVIAMHLLQRIYGTMIRAAEDPVRARAVVDRAEDTMGGEDTCPFCSVMLAVPAAIACAKVGDVEGAERRLARAEASASLWEGLAWEAAVLEARAHLQSARGDPDGAARLADQAAHAFAEAGQPLDAERCRQGAPAPVPAVLT